jgi:protein TonB
MDNNKQYFILGGFLSLTLFSLFIGLFIYMMFSLHEEKSYGLRKENFISVSIVMPKTFAKKSTAKAHIQHMATATASHKSIDVNDLFSDVWTPKISKKTKKRKVNSKRIADIAKKIQSVSEKNVDSLSKEIAKIDNKIADKNKQASSSASEVNEYLAKIQAIVYQHFNVPPNSEGASVKTVIELDPLGRMTDFRILNYSSNAALNEEADKIKDRLKNVIFPRNPQNKSSRTIVVLISKE